MYFEVCTYGMQIIGKGWLFGNWNSGRGRRIFRDVVTLEKRAFNKKCIILFTRGMFMLFFLVFFWSDCCFSFSIFKESDVKFNYLHDYVKESPILNFSTGPSKSKDKSCVRVKE